MCLKFGHVECKNSSYHLKIKSEERQRDGRIDGHAHSITRPVLRRAYKNEVSKSSIQKSDPTEDRQTHTWTQYHARLAIYNKTITKMKSCRDYSGRERETEREKYTYLSYHIQATIALTVTDCYSYTASMDSIHGSGRADGRQYRTERRSVLVSNLRLMLTKRTLSPGPYNGQIQLWSTIRRCGSFIWNCNSDEAATENCRPILTKTTPTTHSNVDEDLGNTT